MSCSSAIYTVNQTQPTLADEAQIPFGSAIRRFGQQIRQDGDNIVLCASGYYDVNCSITVEPSVAGQVTAALYLNGTQVPGGVATATVAAAEDPVNLCIASLVRDQCCDSSLLSLRVSGDTEDTTYTVTNCACVVTKI